MSNDQVIDLLKKAIELLENKPKAYEERTEWRSEPASPKQIDFLDKNKIPYNVSITKGEASDKIDNYFKEQRK